MNTFVIELWDDEGSLCTFYSVKWDDAIDNETDIFFDKYDNIPEYEEATGELLSFILYVIGDDHGAKDELFNRHENEVVGLPVKGKLKLGSFFYHYPQFPLRIYALKITQNIVILFNGGVKDGDTNQTSSLNIRWKEACSFARRIDEAIRAKWIIVDEANHVLKSSDNDDEIIL